VEGATSRAIDFDIVLQEVYFGAPPEVFTMVVTAIVVIVLIVTVIIPQFLPQKIPKVKQQ